MVYVLGVSFIVMVLAIGTHFTETNISTVFGTEVNIGTMEIDLTKTEQ